MTPPNGNLNWDYLSTEACMLHSPGHPIKTTLKLTNILLIWKTGLKCFLYLAPLTCICLSLSTQQQTPTDASSSQLIVEGPVLEVMLCAWTKGWKTAKVPVTQHFSGPSLTHMQLGLAWIGRDCLYFPHATISRDLWCITKPWENFIWFLPE